MSDTPNPIIVKRHQILREFKERWTLKALNKMTLQDYTGLKNQDTFCYWVEHTTIDLGSIKGNFSSMFGIWHMDTVKEGTSLDYIHDGTYKWRKKYGNNAEEAFEIIKKTVIEIASRSQNREFDKLDALYYFSLSKWKIAFLYSNYQLFPVYSKESIRKVAKNFDFPNYSTARISAIHHYMVKHTPKDEDIFEFAFNQYHITNNKTNHNYYLIGSKYRDKSGEYIDKSPDLYDRNVISIGFFGSDDLGHLYGKSKKEISKKLVKNFSKKENFETAKNAHLHFLTIKEGDIVAIKSQGIGGNLTIIAYAEVVSKNGEIYFHDKIGNLGHCIHVNFLETDLEIKTGLTYAQTIIRKRKIF